MCCGNEKQHNVLTESEQDLERFSANHSTGIRHGMDIRMFDFELPNNGPRVTSDDAKNDDEKYSPG